MAKTLFEDKMDSIKLTLDKMLANLNTELFRLTEGKGNFNKGELETILSEIDNAIINDSTVQNVLLGTNVQNQTAIRELITNIQQQIKDRIEEAKETFGLSKDKYDNIMGVYKEKVTGSNTVTRVKTLDDYRSQADQITFDSAKDKLSATTKELETIDDKIAKLEGFKSQLKPGETVDIAVKRLETEIKATTLNNAHVHAIKAINDNKYDYDAAVATLAVSNYSYTVPENVKKTSEFLTELNKLKEGNPEINEIFEELKKVGISPDKAGKITLNNLTRQKRGKLREVINNGLQTKKIDFSEAKKNTSNKLLDKSIAEMEIVLKAEFMKLYPRESQMWAEAIKSNDVALRMNAWTEMKKFLKERDFELELDDIKNLSNNEASLIAKKEELEGKKFVLSKRADGERLAGVKDELRKIQVLGIDIESRKDLVGLTEEDIVKASNKFYKDKKAEFEEQFDRLADPKLKKIGFFEKIGYAISHRTLSPGKAIKAERVENWAKTQIAATISSEAQKTAADKREKEIYYKMGALTPEQLKEFNKKQTDILTKHKKEQEEAILSGATKTADDARKKAKKDTEVELGE